MAATRAPDFASTNGQARYPVQAPRFGLVQGKRRVSRSLISATRDVLSSNERVRGAQACAREGKSMCDIFFRLRHSHCVSQTPLDVLEDKSRKTTQITDVTGAHRRTQTHTSARRRVTSAISSRWVDLGVPASAFGRRVVGVAHVLSLLRQQKV